MAKCRRRSLELASLQELPVTLVSSLDSKEQIRQATDIVDLIGQHISLRREGRIFKGLCPWHDDSRPSLQVNPERQSWKCWVCDVGGDVFSFVMQRERVDFGEALTMLADRTGIELQRQGGDHGDGRQPSGPSKPHLYRAAAWAEAQYHQCLLDAPEGEAGRRYLSERGITNESIHQFHLGFAPNRWDWLLGQLTGSPFDTADLERLGLIGTSTNTNRKYDRFRGRVLFSIRDVQQRAIAMGGRVLPEFADEKSAKYINSPESPLFSKSNQLYGLDIAREPLGKERHAIIVEGYTDCIVAHQFGFTTTLAVLGTALGERHVRLLSRYVDSITLVLDGDEAGQKRASAILDLFIAGELDLRVLTLPDGLDPCDFLFQRGAEAFQAAIDGAADAMDHRIDTATRGIDPSSGSHEANRALEEILKTLAQAPRLRSGGDVATKLREDQFVARLARQFHVAEENLRGRMSEMRRRPSRRSPASSELSADANEQFTISDPWEGELIEILLQEPEAVFKAAESLGPEQLLDPVCRRIFARCCELSTAGTTPALDRLLLEFDHPGMKNLLVALDERGQDRGGCDLAAQLPDLLASLRQRREDHAQRATTAALKAKQFDASEEVQVLHELLEKTRARQRNA